MRVLGFPKHATGLPIELLKRFATKDDLIGPFDGVKYIALRRLADSDTEWWRSTCGYAVDNSLGICPICTEPREPRVE